MTIPRNLSILAEGASSSGVLGAAYGGTGLSSVGTAGNVLTSNGSAWVSSTPSAGAATQGGFRSSATALYVPWGYVSAAATSTSLVQYQVYYLCFVVGQTTTFTKIGTYVTVSTAGALLRMGIYNWSNGIATTRILDAGTVSVAPTGIAEISISQTLSPGVYALACVCDAVGRLRANTGNAGDQGFQYGWADMVGTYTFCLYESGVAATLPATASSTPTAQTSAAGAGPVIYLRV